MRTRYMIQMALAILCIPQMLLAQVAKEDLGIFKFREIGPALTSGRLIDMAVNPENVSEFYVASASGGVWKTQNAGVTFNPIFDGEGSYSIGCVTLDPNNPHTVWVGTGENNNQRSVAYGDGVYRSRDGGKSWKKMGLENSEHIGMIKVDPRNSNVVYVAAYGPLWSEGGDRGLYKTEDGGETWNKILEIDPYTGVNEVHFDPRNPDVIYATAHQRMRKVWTYVGGGPGSAMYKSTDGGKSFRKLTSGLPNGKMGRIGMVVSPVNPDILYAIVEAENEAGGFFKSTDRGESWNKVNKYKTSGNYYQELYADPVDVNKVFMMDTWAHVTYDGGKTIKKLGETNKHVDNHCMWIDPTNTDHYYMGCDGGMYETFDNAKNWQYFPNLPVTQFYKVVTDNNVPFYGVYGGTQDNFSLGGPSSTRKKSGIDNYDWYVTNEGDGFESASDPENPNIVYAQAQYGWLVRYDKASGQKVPIQPQPGKDEPAYRWNWDAPLIVSPHKATRLYFAANKLFKSDDRGNTWQTISPDLTRQLDRNTMKIMGSVPSVDVVMKNRSTTIYGNIVALSESPKKAGLIYIGTDDGLIQVTENDGGEWRKIEGIKEVPERTYVNDVKASLHDENVVYAVFNNHKSGDFKPYIYKSENKGKSWVKMTNGLPERGSVYSLAEDHKDPKLLFAGTEFGVFVTVDGGANWLPLKGGLPTVAVRDIDIQRQQNDLVLATFGRGFWVLDDYSALREINAEAKGKDAVFFNNRPGLTFIYDSKYGYQGTGFQGASFWVGKNPAMGARFTYFVKDVPKTSKAARQSAESEARKNGSDVVYPTKEALRKEDVEEAPYFIFVIKDATGQEVKRFTKVAQAGVQAAMWDGKWSEFNVNNSASPLSKTGSAYLAIPGNYSVSLILNVNDEVTTLVENHPFELTVLNLNTLQTDPAKLIAFQRDLNALDRAANGVNQYYKNVSERVKAAKGAARVSTNGDMSALKSLHDLEVELQAMSIKLYGDKTLGKHQFEIEPSTMDRVGLAAWSSYSNQNESTQIQRNDYAIAKEELKAMIAQLQTINEKLVAIERVLNMKGAPYLNKELPKL
ncbi:glycosyl hydrolase [bacterium SCSIO 12643]|nr:glycosyl hydrolase [bacterium SCSIO 12643]